MEEEILLDGDTMTLDRIDRYLNQRRERAKQGKKSTQDFMLELLSDLMQSEANEDEPFTPNLHSSYELRDALNLINARLEQLDKKIVPSKKEPMPRAMQLAKARCQAVAKFLWQMHPDMTQEDMAGHKDIYDLSITKGKNYTPETIKKWIAEVDPRPEKKKRGRPSKAKK